MGSRSQYQPRTYIRILTSVKQKRVKAAIAHCDSTPAGITLVCHALNWEQRPDKSGFPAELFINRGPQFPGLPTIPNKIKDNSDVKEKREGSRAKQIERAKKGLRKPEVFKPGDTVYLRDSEGKWMIPAEVVNQRQHQGFDTPSYLLKYSKSGSLTTRNERDIRRFPVLTTLSTIWILPSKVLKTLQVIYTMLLQVS